MFPLNSSVMKPKTFLQKNTSSPIERKFGNHFADTAEMCRLADVSKQWRRDYSTYGTGTGSKNSAKLAIILPSYKLKILYCNRFVEREHTVARISLVLSSSFTIFLQDTYARSHGIRRRQHIYHARTVEMYCGGSRPTPGKNRHSAGSQP